MDVDFTDDGLSVEVERVNRPMKPLPSRLSPSNHGKLHESAEFVSSRSPSPITVDDIVARVLEIVPDVSLSYLDDLIASHQQREAKECAEHILHELLENPDYPRLTRPGKRKREDSDKQDERDAIEDEGLMDFSRIDREHTGGPQYQDLALTQLMIDFPFIPKAYVRKALLDMNSFYAPAYIFLAAQEIKPTLPYKPKATKSKIAAKSVATDVLFLAERQWVEARRLQDIIHQDAQTAETVDQEENGGIDCGCCFSPSSFHTMIQCIEGHLFCKECMTQYAETVLGANSHKILCMDQSGCKEEFPEAELERLLTDRLWTLYHRIKQTKEIAAARLDGLEECPFCDFKIVIENEEEKLFRCQNDACFAVTCRACKKADHLPKSCKEMEDDMRLDGRHAVEEALSSALMRNCPKCNKSFIKEEGCNKMRCPECHTLSCYICRKTIDGYEHFDRGGGSSSSQKKCPLWDGTDKINAEIRAAGAKAALDYKAANPDVQPNEINVEVPVLASQPHPERGHQLQQIHPPPMQLQHINPNQAQPYAILPFPAMAQNHAFNFNININNPIAFPAHPPIPNAHHHPPPRREDDLRRALHNEAHNGNIRDLPPEHVPLLPPFRGQNRRRIRDAGPAALEVDAPLALAHGGAQRKRRPPQVKKVRPAWQ